MYLADVGVNCPNCGANFISKQLPLLVDTGRRNSELRQDFEGKFPQLEPYVVCTCPSCGKSDWMNRFGATSEQGTLNQPKATPHLQFRAAALSAEREGRDSFNVGMFYLYAAWCADDNRSYPQAREYRRLATDCFKKSLIDMSCPSDTRMAIEYVIGELLRRCGDFEDSKQYFRQVMPKLSAKYALMARKLMRLAEMRSIESIPFDSSEQGAR
jgi:uncharacterized protein (DUF2225 family)